MMTGAAIIIESSDGDASHRPGPSSGRVPAKHEEVVTYRSKVGDLIAPSLDDHKSGLNYILKSLPENYALYRYHRPGGSSKHVDKFLYGHPSHYIFNSTNDFKPHAIWLLSDQEGECQCNGCKKLGNQPKVAAKQARRVGRPPKGTSRSKSDGSNKALGSGRVLREKPTAAEMSGNESIFTRLMTDLKREGQMDETIRDPDNIALEIEQRSFTSAVSTLVTPLAHRFRVGELILFQIPMLNQESTEWRAGLVTELPHTAASSSVPASSTPSVAPAPATSDLAINYTGYRIETMSDPNSHRKDEQSQWGYSPEPTLRPFKLNPFLVDDESQAHKSVENARKCLASFSLALPSRFTGHWPDAYILFGGIYIGAELLVVGDYADILPTDNGSTPGGTDAATVMKITSIVLKFTGLEPDPPSQSRVTGDYCDSIEVRLHGRLLSSSTQDGDHMSLDSPTNDSTVNHHPKHLHALYPEEKIHSLPLSLVGGRHIPPGVLAAYNLPNLRDSSVTEAISTGLIEGRAWASDNDTRILQLNEDIGGDPKAGWWWANDRVEALGVDRFGENDVGETFEKYLAKERLAYEG